MTRSKNPIEFKKVTRLGKQGERDVFVSIEYQDGRLSITGVIAPRKDGDAANAGQILDNLSLSFTSWAPGWGRAKCDQLLAYWRKWHLNDLTAGSPAQEQHLEDYPVKYQYPVTHYDTALKALKKAGLQPDKNYLKDGKPYAYGSAWLMTEVPGEVLEWLKALPKTDKVPAWI